MKKYRFTVIFAIIISLFLPIKGEARAVRQENLIDPLVSGQNVVYLPLVRIDIPGYFVSPTGNDQNPGSFLSPWKTIGKAAQTAVAGDTVVIRGGIYYESVHFRNSGTETRPIIIKAHPGETPIMDGKNSGELSSLNVLNIKGDYIHVSGIEVRNSANDGIKVSGSYDIVDNMFVHHNQKHGILITEGKYSVVQNSRIWRNATLNEFNKAGHGSTAITAARNGVYFATIRHNVISENWGTGLSTYESDHTIIEDNIIHDNYSSNVYLSDTTNALFQRNLVYTDPQNFLYPYSKHNGITLQDERNTPISANNRIINNISIGNEWNLGLFTGSSVMNNILIANNTFVNGIESENVLLRGNHQNVQFMNNIVVQEDDLPVIAIRLAIDVHLSNNLWSKTPPSNASGPGDIVQDPLLKRTGSPFSPDWFRLTANSPAINHTLSIPQVLTDFFQITRGSHPDMGAIEYVP